MVASKLNYRANRVNVKNRGVKLSHYCEESCLKMSSNTIFMTVILKDF